MNLRNLFTKKQPEGTKESQRKVQSVEKSTTELVKDPRDFALEEMSLEESQLVFPFLKKLKVFCRRRALDHAGGFGGCCDACSVGITRDSFYFLGGWARCENCIDKALYQSTKWYFYLVNLESWEPAIPYDLIVEGANIRDSVDKLRRAALGKTSLDLTGSVWDYRESNGEKGFFRFEANGSLRYRPSTDIERSGRWRQDGSVIYMEINNRFCEYDGTTTGTRIEGTAHNANGNKWTWTAYYDWPH